MHKEKIKSLSKLYLPPCYLVDQKARTKLTHSQIRSLKLSCFLLQDFFFYYCRHSHWLNSASFFMFSLQNIKTNPQGVSHCPANGASFQWICELLTGQGALVDSRVQATNAVLFQCHQRFITWPVHFYLVLLRNGDQEEMMALQSQRKEHYDLELAFFSPLGKNSNENLMFQPKHKMEP